MVRAPAKGIGGQWQARSTDELRNLTSLAQAAVGFDATRGDVVSVQDISFEENRMQVAPSISAQVLSKVETSPVLVKYLSLLIGLIVVLSFGVRPALGKVASAIRGAPREFSRGTTAVSQMVLPSVEAALPDAERARAQKIVEQVAGQIKSEPAQSSRLLQSWIHSD
jgi:flagellar M-ring protein FliF